jgi:hypothetical protein
VKVNPFARLLGLQRSARTRDRLLELRSKHALTEDDPIWDLVSVVEQYCADLREQNMATQASPAPSMASATTPTPSTPSSPPARYRARAAALCCAAAAVQTLVLSVAFMAGATATKTSTKSLLVSALTLPVGWVVLVLALPLFAGLTTLGWRIRRRESAVGWTLMLAGSVTTVSLGAALWRVLR